MPVWKVISVDDQPVITVRDWKIFRYVEGDVICGYCIENMEGRVSSYIQEFDKENMVAKTTSGRIYQLQPYRYCLDPDAQYVLNRILFANNIEMEDVSNEYTE